MHSVETARSPEIKKQCMRISQRSRDFSAAILAQDNLSEPLHCLIRDISQTGAQIRVNAAQPIPELGYMINLRTRSAYEAKAVWRRGSLAGFSLGKQHTINSTLSADLEFLRSLFVEAKLRQVDRLIGEGQGTTAALRKCGVGEQLYRSGRGIFLS